MASLLNLSKFLLCQHFTICPKFLLFFFFFFSVYSSVYCMVWPLCMLIHFFIWTRRDFFSNQLCGMHNYIPHVKLHFLYVAILSSVVLVNNNNKTKKALFELCLHLRKSKRTSRKTSNWYLKVVTCHLGMRQIWRPLLLFWAQFLILMMDLWLLGKNYDWRSSDFSIWSHKNCNGPVSSTSSQVHGAWWDSLCSTEGVSRFLSKFFKGWRSLERYLLMEVSRSCAKL